MELKTLISLYVRIKLKENGSLPNEQLPEQEDLEKEILSATLEICSEIEHDARFPEILAPFRSYGIELEIFSTVVEQLLDDGLNWPRVMSVVSLVAALAVECMERGDLHKIDLIQDWASAFSEERVNPWIESNGGLVVLNISFFTISSNNN